LSLVRFIKVDEVYCSVDTDYGTFLELAEQLTFEIPNKKFHPLVESGQWDGNIRLLNKMNKLMYGGLIDYAAKLAEEGGHTVEIDNGYAEDPFSTSECSEFIDKLKVPFPPHDFQEDAFIHCIQHRRALVLSPTSSGKSFLMYLILMYLGLKTLIIAPSKGLVKQLAKELKGYGYPGEIEQVMQDTSKGGKEMVTISTWQSIYKLPKTYFGQFPVIIADEVHKFDSKCLKQLMEKTVDCSYKIGVTGSLDGTKTHELVLTGLFGPIYETITTREMIDRDIASDLEIKVMLFSYPEEDTKKLQFKRTYKDEVDFIISHPLRNKFIVNLANSLPGNGLILFRRVEKHGKIIKDMLEAAGKKPVYFIHGAVDADEREEIRTIAENNDEIVILASDGTTSTGTSINNIQWMMKVQPIKGQINNVQSIGRGLRKDFKDNMLKYFDLADELPPTTGGKAKGFHYEHLVERMRIYVKSKFPFKVYKIRLEEK
jgi:superfamily II DNA or RNA helicase